MILWFRGTAVDVDYVHIADICRKEFRRRRIAKTRKGHRQSTSEGYAEIFDKKRLHCIYR